MSDKVAKNQRKTFGTLRDLLRVRTVGIINADPKRGIVEYAKPVGVAVIKAEDSAATHTQHVFDCGVGPYPRLCYG